MRFYVQWVVGAVVFLLANAQGVSAQGPPINTDTAFVNGLQGAAFRSFVFSVNRSGLVRDGQDIIDPFDQDVSIFAIPIVVPYEVVKNKLDLVGGIPVLHKRMAFTEDGERQELTTPGSAIYLLGLSTSFCRRTPQGRQLEWRRWGESSSRRARMTKQMPVETSCLGRSNWAPVRWIILPVWSSPTSFGGLD